MHTRARYLPLVLSTLLAVFSHAVPAKEDAQDANAAPAAGGVQCIEHRHLMDEATAKLLADIGLIAEPAKNLLVIMKDGQIYKNALPD